MHGALEWFFLIYNSLANYTVLVYIINKLKKEYKKGQFSLFPSLSNVGELRERAEYAVTKNLNVAIFAFLTFKNVRDEAFELINSKGGFWIYLPWVCSSNFSD